MNGDLSTPGAASGWPLPRAWAGWNRFWFEPIPAARVGLVRIWLFGFACVDVLLRREVWAGMGQTPRLFWHPVGATWLLDGLGVGAPDTWMIRAIQIVLAIAAASAAIGYRYRVTAPIAALLYLYWQCLGQSWGEMKHARVTIVLGLLVLSAVAANRQRSIDAVRARRAVARRERRVVLRPDIDEPSVDGAFAVRFIQVALAVLYFTSGYSKLRAVGIDWMWSDTLRQAIQDKNSSGEATFIGLFALRHRSMLLFLQVVSLIWEVTFPLVFFRRFRYPVLVVGLLFNIGIWTTVRIEFFGVLACFAAFVPLERIEQSVREWLARRRPAASVQLAYDSGCDRCNIEATRVVAADWTHSIRPVDVSATNAATGTPMSITTDDGVVSGHAAAELVSRRVVPLMPPRVAVGLWHAFGRLAGLRDSALPHRHAAVSAGHLPRSSNGASSGVPASIHRRDASTP